MLSTAVPPSGRTRLPFIFGIPQARMPSCTSSRICPLPMARLPSNTLHQPRQGHGRRGEYLACAIFIPCPRVRPRFEKSQRPCPTALATWSLCCRSFRINLRPSCATRLRVGSLRSCAGDCRHRRSRSRIAKPIPASRVCGTPGLRIGGAGLPLQIGASCP